METKIFTKQTLEEAAELIRLGQLIAFPTETVYGLGADANNVQAVTAVYQAKGRPSDNPLIVHVASPATVADYVPELPSHFQALTERFWPGPLTIILPIKPNSLAPQVTGGLSTAAFRMPNNDLTLALISLAGRPIVGPSANISGRPSPTTAQHVLHDLTGKIAGVIDGGPTTIGVESTVLDLSGSSPVILRPGAITEEDLAPLLGEVLVAGKEVTAGEIPKAPGMKYKHYAPKATVLMLQAAQTDWSQALTEAQQKKQRVGFLVSSQVGEQLPKEVGYYPLTQKHSVEEAMQNLFAGLRFLDEQEPPITTIFVETFPNQGRGRAYMNRLSKAANQRFFAPCEKNL